VSESAICLARLDDKKYDFVALALRTSHTYVQVEINTGVNLYLAKIALQRHTARWRFKYHVKT